MTTRDEAKEKLTAYAQTVQLGSERGAIYQHAGGIIDTLMPLFNRAERTAGTVEVCPNSFHNNSPRCLGETAGGRHDCRWDNCPIRSGAKA